MPPRPLRPKDEPGIPDGSDSAPEPKGSKRRAVSSACIPCRKRKSKCDGALPACSTCIAVYRTECSYDADSDHRRKGALKRDIQSLQQQNDALDVIVASLRGLPEPESIALLRSIRNDVDLVDLASSLRSNVSLPQSFASQTLEADFAEHMSQASSHGRIDSSALGNIRPDSTDNSQKISNSASPADIPANWFSGPQDAEFIEHLLSLHFCWVHPYYQFFSRELFLSDMSRGGTDFCSALLVNALLALACHYSDRPSARSDPSNSFTAGDNFFKEAKRLLDNIDTPSLTTVQALMIMGVREASHGRDSSGYQYTGRSVRMALELGLHLSVISSGLRASENEALGFSKLTNHSLCAVFVGKISQLPRAAADTPKPTISERSESQVWRYYEETNLSLNLRAEQPSRSMLFFDRLSRLSELASDMVTAFYAPQETFTSRRLAAAYAQYQEWYRTLPDPFRLENTSLPHVIVLHMYYYGCVLQPYIKLDLQGANLFPRDVCTFCANEMSGLMSALRAMYGLRRVCLPVASLLLSASTIHLLNLPSEPAATHLTQGLHDLHAMSINHRFGGRFIEIIHSLATKWNIALPEAAATLCNFQSTGQKQWPSPSASTFWAPSIPRERSSESGMRSSGSNSSHQDSPFRPPPLPPPGQRPSTYPNFFNDSNVPIDPNQAHNVLWTPFPVQTMPAPPQSIVPSMPMDFSPMDTPMNNWTLADRPAAGPSNRPETNMQQTAGHSPLPNVMAFPNWHAWQ